MSRSFARALSAFGFGLAVTAMLAAGVPVARGQDKNKKALIVPPAPQAPTLTSAAAPVKGKAKGKGGTAPAPAGEPTLLLAKPGTASELVLTGTNLADAAGVLLSCPGSGTVAGKASGPAEVRVTVDLPADTPIGMHTLRVVTKDGVSNFRPLVVDDLPAVAEVGTNHTLETAQTVPVPCAVTGRVAVEQSGFFRLKVAAGQTLTFEVLARRIGSPLDPVVRLYDAESKREFTDLYADDTPGLQSDCRVTHTFKRSTDVIAEVRHTEYKGGADFYYRLRIGEFPGVMTAFPLALQRGQAAKVGFTGPGAADVPPQPVTAPADPTVAAVNVVPKRLTGAGGWPVPVLLTDEPQAVEQEPNNEPAKANKLPVPGGVSARFAAKGDVDHFAIPGKKGQKLVILARTYELNAPTEVLVRLLDAKGKEVARSNPAQTSTRVEFTPPADGEYVVACENLNYLHGPGEVYHLSVLPAAADVEVTVALDRYEAPAGGGTAVAVAEVTRLNGYAGPVELSIVGGPNLSGRATVPAGQTQAFVPLLVKAGTRPGAYPFQVRATVKADGKDVARFATLTDLVKANLGGIPNPPPELLGGCVVAVVEKPAFAVTLTADPPAVEKGKGGKLLAEATREKAADVEITLAPLLVAPNLTPTFKPIPKGQTKAEAALAVAAGATTGPNAVVVRATTKVGGKDYAVTPPPVVVDVTEPKKAAPKKEDPKKKPDAKKDKK